MTEHYKEQAETKKHREEAIEACGHDRTATITLDTLADLVNDMLPVTQKPIECDDVVSKQAVEEIINDIRDCISVEGYCAILERLKKLPPVRPQEQTGHWISLDTEKPSRIKDGMTTESVKCSECDEWLTASDEYACNGNYCPNCGACMKDGRTLDEFIEDSKESENP